MFSALDYTIESSCPCIVTPATTRSYIKHGKYVGSQKGLVSISCKIKEIGKMHKKVSKQYQFRVFVICDGDCYGLLIEKMEPLSSVPQYAYFWHDGGKGLAPTEEIKRHCGENCHKLVSSEKYESGSHVHARLRDQEIIFLELLDYAKWAASNGYKGSKLQKAKNLRIDYKTYDKGYAGVLSSFFNKKRTVCALRDFMDKLYVYTDYVLESPYGSDTVIGKAKEFSFRDPHNPLPEKNLIYLQDAEKLLKINNSSGAEWFRPDGPLFSDFVDKRVHRRSILDSLKKTVFEKPAYLLKGEVATGKSVIVRQLMYELLDNHIIAYCFDVSGDRGFKRDTLLREILSVTGLIIIENVHLEPQKVDWVLSRVTQGEDKHLLFTARTSIDDFKGLFNQEIHRVESKTLRAFEEADKIIDCFLRHPDTPSEVSNRREELLKVSKDNFWLLSFALLGCAASQGKGEPQSWISNRVNDYLASLKELRDDKYCQQYPEIVLALCPLYKNEVVTEQSYLTDMLGLNEDAIEGLARRGEITRQETEDGLVFYGLPHSALADAYWEHGKKHRRKLPEYEDFIDDYASSGMSNGLKAVVCVGRGVGTQILDRLDACDKLANTIKKERDTSIVAELVKVANADIMNKTDIADAVARKIEECNDLIVILKCIFFAYYFSPKLCRKTWELCKNKFAHRLNHTEDVEDIATCIGDIHSASLGMAKELCVLFSFKQIATNLNQSQELRGIINCICRIHNSNQETCQKIWGLCKERLAAKLNQTDDIEDIIICIGMIRYTSPDMAKELCGLLGHTELAMRLNQSQELENIGRCINKVHVSNTVIGQKIWELCKERLAAKLSQTENVGDAAICIGNIRNASLDMAKELCDLLDVMGLAMRLNQSHELGNIGDCIRWIQKSNSEKCQIIWEHCKDELAAKLSQTEDVEDATKCTNEIHSASPDMAKELCGLLEPKQVAANLIQSRRTMDIGFWICRIHYSNPERCQNIWELCKEWLAAKLSQTEDLWDTGRCIEIIHSASRDMTKELCGLLNPDEFAVNLNESHDLENIGYCISVVHGSNLEKCQEIWKLCKVRLATKLSQTEVLWSAGRCIEKIYSASLGMAKELCDLLDVPKVAYTLINREIWQVNSVFLEIIKRADERVYQELIKLLDGNDKDG